MQRPERVLTIGISAIFCTLLRDYLAPYHYTPEGWAFPLLESISVFTFPIFIMAILTNMTAMQRMRDSKKALKGS
jgi:CDP-diacylglycerol--glycerol-3-phosphate 3-phosphatidyltransferase